MNLQSPLKTQRPTMPVSTRVLRRFFYSSCLLTILGILNLSTCIEGKETKDGIDVGTEEGKGANADGDEKKKKVPRWRGKRMLSNDMYQRMTSMTNPEIGKAISSKAINATQRSRRVRAWNHILDRSVSNKKGHVKMRTMLRNDTRALYAASEREKSLLAHTQDKLSSKLHQDVQWYNLAVAEKWHRTSLKLEVMQLLYEASALTEEKRKTDERKKTGAKSLLDSIPTKIRSVKLADKAMSNAGLVKKETGEDSYGIADLSDGLNIEKRLEIRYVGETTNMTLQHAKSGKQVSLSEKVVEITRTETGNANAGGIFSGWFSGGADDAKSEGLEIIRSNELSEVNAFRFDERTDPGGSSSSSRSGAVQKRRGPRQANALIPKVGSFVAYSLIHEVHEAIYQENRELIDRILTKADLPVMSIIDDYRVRYPLEQKNNTKDGTRDTKKKLKKDEEPGEVKSEVAILGRSMFEIELTAMKEEKAKIQSELAQIKHKFYADRGLVDPHQYLSTLQNQIPGIHGHRVYSEKRAWILGHEMVMCGRQMMCQGLACEYTWANRTGDGSLFVGFGVSMFYNRTVCPELCSCKKSEWKVSHHGAECSTTLVPTRTIFLNRPIMSGHLGFGSRINNWLRIANLVMHVGNGFQISHHACPVELRGHPFCFFQPVTKCGTQSQSLNSDGWVFEPNYYAVCRFILGAEFIETELNMCMLDELYMYRLIFEKALVLQPDLENLILRKYLNQDAVHLYPYIGPVGKAGKDGKSEKNAGVEASPTTSKAPAKHFIPGNPPALEKNEDGQDLQIRVPSRLQSERDYYQDLSRPAKESRFSNEEIFAYKESKFYGKLVDTTTRWPPYAAIHMRATDNRERFWYGACGYAERIDLQLRFWKGDDDEYDRLMKTPGGWHNSLERLVEDASANQYSSHVTKKKEFNMRQLLEGRFSTEEEFQDLWQKEVKRIQLLKKKKALKAQSKMIEKLVTDEDGSFSIKNLTGNHTDGEIAPNLSSNAKKKTRKIHAVAFSEDLSKMVDVEESNLSKVDFVGNSMLSEESQRLYTDASLLQSEGEEEEIIPANPRMAENSTEAWVTPTEIRTIFIATDNCTMIEEFQQCEAYHRNKWTIRTFCRKLLDPDKQKKKEEFSALGNLDEKLKENQKMKEATDGEVVVDISTGAKAKATPVYDLLETLITGEVDISEFENIRWTAEMARDGVWTHPKRGSGAEDMYRMWAELVILAKSSFALGTFTSNFGRLVQVMRTQPQKTMESLDVRWKHG